MVSLQRHELARREAKADTQLDVQQMLSDAADLGPVHHNAPDRAFTGLDKGGFTGAPISEEEAPRMVSVPEDFYRNMDRAWPHRRGEGG